MYSKLVRLFIITAILVSGLAITPNAFAGSEACDTRVNNTFEKLLECVTLAGVREHQAAFQAIADANGRDPRCGDPRLRR